MDQQSSEREREGGPALAQKGMSPLAWVGAIALTLGARLYLFFHYYTINNDGVLYIEAARRFWQGNWVDGLASFYPPFFPLMIAAAYPITGEWELAGQFWPFLLGALMIFPLFGLLRGVYGYRVAQWAIFFYAVSPYLARLSLHVRSEVPYIFFLVLAVYFLQRALDEAGRLSIFAAGLGSALAYLIRSEGFGFILIGVLFLLHRGWNQRHRKAIGLQLTLLLFGFALLAAPYILYLKHDTGNWLISRKAGLIMSFGLADYDPDAERVGMKDSDRVSVLNMIASRPVVYAKKVFIDAFRSLGVYFEAVHYSYLPFLFIGWFLFFRGRFWKKEDFLLFAVVLFYLATFALLYVNRRYAVTLVPFSLGWVGLGFLSVEEYFRNRWQARGALLTGLVLVLFMIGTLPKTLQSIGREKLYLREAGAYLKGKPGNTTILTTNGRVAFYAEGQNRVFLKEVRDFPALLSTKEADYLALDQEFSTGLETLLQQKGWRIDREFSGRPGESLLILVRQRD